MIRSEQDNSIRLKVTNDCQWTCNFCHNEGTELPENANNRVSTLLDLSVLSLPHVENMSSNESALDKIVDLRKIGIDEVHFTGGEPTLHPKLANATKRLVSEGFRVKMTSNGQSSNKVLKDIIEAGLYGVTFSILALNPEDFLKTQNPPKFPGLDPLKWAERMIVREKTNIILAKEMGVDVKINTAVLGVEDYPRVDAIREFAQEQGITLVVLPVVGDQHTNQQVVFEYAESYGEYQYSKENSNNSNGARVYSLPNGTQLRAKYLRQHYPDVVCNGCEHKGKTSCIEKFYGIRVEFRGGEPYTRLCIQKTTSVTVMPLQTFLDNDMRSKLVV